MERIGDGINFPPACFLCPARTYTEGEYRCDPGKLDPVDSHLSVAHYQSMDCPNKFKIANDNASAEILLRKILHK